MKRPFLIGVTGSIGMGKSTVAKMFRDAGIAVWEADAAVHRLYAAGGDGVSAVRALHPDAVVDGAIDRERLKTWIARDGSALGQLERAIHPLVARDRDRFVAAAGDAVVVLDIPLLFETGGEAQVDLVAVVSAPPEVQRRRVLDRPDMNAEQFERLLAKQMPDEQKRSRADVVIVSVDLADTRRQVDDVLAQIREDRQHA